MDWTPSRRDTITVQGDFVNGLSIPQGYLGPISFPDPLDFTKATFLTRWTHKVDDDTDWSAQCYYYDPYGRNRVVMETNANFDFDFQYHTRLERHDVVCGFGYRNDDENVTFTFGPFVMPVLDTEQIPSYFVQDTITLVEDRLFATVGSKFDHNSVTHFEYQPTAKLAWTPNERTSLWGAITRAVRTPSLHERLDSKTIKSEDMLSYELGCRRQPDDKFFWELSGFFSRYHNLLATRFPLFFPSENVGSADVYGFEHNATYQVSPTWHLTGSYSFCIERIEYPPGYNSDFTSGTTPRNQFYLQSGWDLGHDVTFDVMFRYVDSLRAGVQKYFVGDIRLAWRPRKNLEMSVVGQNLFDGPHYEFVDTGLAGATEVEPGVYGMISWRY